MFGLEHLKNFVGEVTFFERLPSIMETRLHNGGSVGTAGGSGLPAHPFNLLFNARREVVVPRLLERCNVLGQQTGRSVLRAMRNAQDEVASISQTLGAGLLEHIRATLLDVCEGNPSRRTDQIGDTDHDTANARSTVKEIVALQMTLQGAEDENEKRALEEDITGKILWCCWHAVFSEVDQLLANVVESVQKKQYSDTLRQGFREVAEIIKGAPRIHPDDDIAHLQQIMLDAGAGISRHELWLAARAGEKARFSRVVGGKPILSTASPKVPSTSIIQQPLAAGKTREGRR
ncbi:hypothetical protein BKA82DRAFT_4144198 [Pisolithus tinctorius]|nr:hypothetical protein BKA82DRAFT_4144198 [Pisolithus tinctorius]